eukprot:126729-Rhodomonas_salina.1
MSGPTRVPGYPVPGYERYAYPGSGYPGTHYFTLRLCAGGPFRACTIFRSAAEQCGRGANLNLIST